LRVAQCEYDDAIDRKAQFDESLPSGFGALLGKSKIRLRTSNFVSVATNEDTTTTASALSGYGELT